MLLIELWRFLIRKTFIYTAVKKIKKFKYGDKKIRNKYIFNYKNSIAILTITLIAVILFSSLLFSSCSSISKKKEVISTHKVNEIIEAKKDYIILDVRTQEEYDAGHIINAILIPVDDLEVRISEIPKGKSIIVYCRSGRRSAKAADILQSNNFYPVYDMMGGIEKWKDDGYFLVGDSVTYNIINIDKVFEIVKNKHMDFQIIDVRSTEEYNDVHIKGALSIPVSELEDKSVQLSKDLPVIVYCSSSACGSSSFAAGILSKQGFIEVFAMDSGIEEWLEKGYPVET